MPCGFEAKKHLEHVVYIGVHSTNLKSKLVEKKIERYELEWAGERVEGPESL